MTVDSEELAQGTLVANRYRIVRKLAAGGMGAVYEAVQEGLGRRVALKVLLGNFAQDPDVIARFQREAQAAASLGHPNIISVTDFGSSEGRVFSVMELLAGNSLADTLASERWLSPQRAAWIASQSLAALSVAHRAGIVHRDMKPDNVFLTEVSGVRDVVKVLDFGVARFTELAGSNSKLTATGTVLGTPSYMAPEQARGRSVDARSDLYSVGVMLYEMLAGRLPFQATNYNALLFAILEETPPRIESMRGDVPPALIAVIDRAMGRDPDTRFQDADAMRAALAPFAQPGSSAVDAYARTGAMPQVPMPTPAPGAVYAPVASAPTLAASSAPSWTPSTPMGSSAPTPVSTPVSNPVSNPAYPARAPQPRSALPIALGLGAIVLVTGATSAALMARRGARIEAAPPEPPTAPLAAPAIAPPPTPRVTPTPTVAPPLDSASPAPDDPPAAHPLRAHGRNRPSVEATPTPAPTEHTSATYDEFTLRFPTRPVETSVTGGVLPGTSAAAVQQALGPVLPNLTRCANRALVSQLEANNNHWGMDFDVVLDANTGTILTAVPHDASTRARSHVAQCVIRWIVGQTIVTPPLRSTRLQISFSNYYR